MTTPQIEQGKLTIDALLVMSRDEKAKWFVDRGHHSLQELLDALEEIERLRAENEAMSEVVKAADEVHDHTQKCNFWSSASSKCDCEVGDLRQALSRLRSKLGEGKADGE